MGQKSVQTLTASNAMLTGRKRTGFSANAFVLNTNVPNNSIIVGQYPKHRTVPNRHSVRSRCFDANGLNATEEVTL